MSWGSQAVEKLNHEYKGGDYDQYAQIMKQSVKQALENFCQQDEEFAQAVAQGGTFESCMKEVAKNCGNGISDLEAFRRAVRFYFPGSDIQFHMTIDLCASVRSVDDGAKAVVLNLADFL